MTRRAEILARHRRPSYQKRAKAKAQAKAKLSLALMQDAKTDRVSKEWRERPLTKAERQSGEEALKEFRKAMDELFADYSIRRTY